MVSNPLKKTVQGKLGVVEHARNYSSWEAEAGELQVQA